MTNPDIAAAATRAADWLEANPDKHVTGCVAIDKNTRIVPVLSDKAVCFCAIGRLAKELNVEIRDDYAALHAVIGANATANIFMANDFESRVAGIAELRKLT